MALQVYTRPESYCKHTLHNYVSFHSREAFIQRLTSRRSFDFRERINHGTANT